MTGKDTSQPSRACIAQVEMLKAHGNELFGREKFGAAIEAYTEAITLNPNWAVLYGNRALCYRKREDWPAVKRDSERALELDSSHMKAHYLLGLALREDGQHVAAISHLTKALDRAREKGDQIKDDIWAALARAKYDAWQVESAGRRAELAGLRKRLHGLLEAELLREGQSPSSAERQRHNEELAAWDRVFSMAAASDVKREVPSTYTCPLTMEVFRDPAITPSGSSYERAALLEHLAKVGSFDPITREPMTEKDLVSNIGLRRATQEFLDEHQYGWGECL